MNQNKKTARQVMKIDGQREQDKQKGRWNKANTWMDRTRKRWTDQARKTHGQAGHGKQMDRWCKKEADRPRQTHRQRQQDKWTDK